MRQPFHFLIRLLAACVFAAVPTSAYAQSANANTAYGPWMNVGLPRVAARPFSIPWDPDIQFIIRDGVRGQQFAASCSATAPNQPPVNGARQLLVGNGWTLACAVPPSFVTLERMLQGQDGSFYCWKGVASSYRTVSDARLRTQVMPGNSGQPWWLQAWTTGPSFWVQPISFSGGWVWPLWLEVSYQTIDLAPARNSSCAGVLR